MILIDSRLGLLLGLLGIPALVGAVPHAESLLQRMAHTMHTANYEGLMLHVQGQGSETRTMHIIHLYDPQHGERERLTSLDGPEREVIQDKERCICIWPRARLMVSGRVPAWRSQFSAERFGETTKLGQYYDFVSNGDGRVANLGCKQIRLVPKDAYRHGYRLCIHEPSAMLLRLELLDGERRLEMSQFVQLRLNPEVGEDVLRPRTSIQGFRVVEEPAMDQAFQPRWLATTLPPGYSLRSAVERISPHTGKPVEHHIYSDGLASISIFIERQTERPMPHPSAYGAMQRLVRTSDGMRLIAIGEAPEAAMRLILEGLKPVERP